MHPIFGIVGMAGGLFLLTKAVAILATGNQPPILFEVAPALQALALFGLVAPVLGLRRRTRWFAQAIAILVIIAAAGGLLLDDDSGVALEETTSSLLDVVSGLGPIMLLLVLGFPIKRRYLWPGRWRFLPLVLGFGIIPAIAVGVILEGALGERYLEIPLVIIAAGWIALGYRMGASRAQLIRAA